MFGITPRIRTIPSTHRHHLARLSPAVSARLAALPTVLALPKSRTLCLARRLGAASPTGHANVRRMYSHTPLYFQSSSSGGPPVSDPEVASAALTGAVPAAVSVQVAATEVQLHTPEEKQPASSHFPPPPSTEADVAPGHPVPPSPQLPPPPASSPAVPAPAEAEEPHADEHSYAEDDDHGPGHNGPPPAVDEGAEESDLQALEEQALEDEAEEIDDGEAEAEAEKRETLSPKVPGDSDTDRRRERKKLIHMAKASLRYAELLSADNIHKYVTVTIVLTPSGVRWIDVSARPALFENRLLARQPEADFVACVMRALRRKEVSLDMHASILSTGTLPSVQVHEGWVGLSLRTPKFDFGQADPYNAVLAMSTMAASGGAGSCGGDVEDTGGADALAVQARARLTERLYAESRSVATYKEVAARAAGGTAGPLPPSAGSPAVPPPLPAHKRASRRAAGAGGGGGGLGKLDPVHDDPAEFYYYDEDQNQFFSILQGTHAGLRSWLLPWNVLRERDRAHIAAYKQRGANRKGGLLAWARGGGVGGSSGGKGAAALKAPTMAEETERLSIFLFKEVHPIETADEATRPSSAAITSATKLGYLEQDEHGNEVFNTTRNRSAPADSSKPKKLPLRWLVVTIHRGPVPFVQETLSRWDEFLANGGRLRTEYSNALQMSFVNTRKIGWEDIVRHLFDQSVRSVQRGSIGQTRSLDILEVEVFDDSRKASERVRRRRNMLGELHLLSRRASMYTDILKEGSIAYRKLKKIVDSPLTATDRKALAFAESAVSLSRSLEEQAQSLLLLQFSVAMNQMETHLRTLTIFSTFFTPLSFIVSSFSMQFAGISEFREHGYSLYVMIVCLMFVGGITSRWISVNIT